MFKKMIKWFKDKLFNNQNKLRISDLNVKNHTVMINKQHYFLAKAMVTDIPEILEIEKKVYNGNTPWSSEAFISEFQRMTDRYYLVIRYHDKLVAFAGCSFNDKKLDCHVTNVAVDPDFQSRGLGYFLITKIIKKARQMEFKSMSLEVRISNFHAQRLYEDLGFKKKDIKKAYYDGDHEDAIDMKLDLVSLDSSPTNFGM
ncbi:ribosomal protein S18-alanine N-acetyltransferase [Apilactobacillus ozensis]|nr:ribosomal protein S18-alanine N-acetyltransferase [Apilactobacillus ozensis]